jgi:hypothetical protein
LYAVDACVVYGAHPRDGRNVNGLKLCAATYSTIGGANATNRSNWPNARFDMNRLNGASIRKPPPEQVAHRDGVDRRNLEVDLVETAGVRPTFEMQQDGALIGGLERRDGSRRVSHRAPREIACAHPQRRRRR